MRRTFLRTPRRTSPAGNGFVDHRRRTPEFLKQLLAASAFAYRRYQVMSGARYGIRWMRNYVLRNESCDEEALLGREGPMKDFLPELRDLALDEHPFSGFRYVRQFNSMIVEPPIYLAALVDEVRLGGAEIRVAEIPDREAVRRLPERVVINCTGLGAKALFGDEELTPIKGQLTFLLPQPEVDYAVLQNDLYMFPRSDGILLGGTHEHDV